MRFTCVTHLRWVKSQYPILQQLQLKIQTILDKLT